MILYFSGTGNTKFIATNLAKRLDDKTIDLARRIKNNDYSDIESDKVYIICLPVYICTLPKFLYDYILKINLKGSNKIYFIYTSGGYTGNASCVGKKLARKKGMLYLGYNEFKMPRNYVLSSHYPPNTEEEIKERLTLSYKKLDNVYNAIKNESKIKERHAFLLEKLIIIPFVPIWSRFAHKTDGFYVTDKCISCTKCKNMCPINVIEMKDNKPNWTKKNCIHCMSCLQNCPCDAIEFMKKTEGKDRYSITRYKDFVSNLTNSK